ncbi:hypothetical protein J8L98_24575, partial [Pseudoalteromonas sp. MMG013]|uniref:hypothetical protein n=1 Tax=Pseudoalteromonas sp. MMG013 TaxID=2822687 RepID=UPI001B35AC4F
MNKNFDYRYILSFFFTLSVISGCASTNTKSKGWDIELGSCQARVHPTRTNATADFLACFHNYNKNMNEVNICMLEQGWSELQDVSCDTTSKFYTNKEIDSCLDSSNENSNISYEKMNSCLAQFNEYEYEVDTKEIKSAIKKLLEEQVN